MANIVMHGQQYANVYDWGSFRVQRSSRPPYRGSFLHILLRRRRLLHLSQCFWCFTAFWTYGCFRFGATTSIGFATSFLRFATLIFGGYCFELICICSYVRGVATALYFVHLWPHSAVTKMMNIWLAHMHGVHACTCYECTCIHYDQYSYAWSTVRKCI